jgi:hypothetical protein
MGPHGLEHLGQEGRGGVVVEIDHHVVQSLKSKVQSRGGAGARQGCSEAQGAAKSGRGLPQSKTLRVFGGVGERGSVLDCASPLALYKARLHLELA